MSEIRLSDRFAELTLACRTAKVTIDAVNGQHRVGQLAFDNADTILAALRAQESNADAVKAAVEAERESCAKIADERRTRSVWPATGAVIDAAIEDVASAIRARSSAPPVPAPIDEAAERKAFEAWSKSRDAEPLWLDRYNGDYVYGSAAECWSAWLARARSEKE